MLTSAEAASLSLSEVSNQLRQEIVRAIQEETDALNSTQARVKELAYRLQNDPDLQTDRSENASYQIAKDEFDTKTNICNMKRIRIESLQSELQDYNPSGFITIGTTVELRVVRVINYDNLDFLKKDGKVRDTIIVKMVNHNTSNASRNLVAIDSIVGKAIMGRVAGDEVIVTAPFGVITYKIERIY